MSDNFTDFNNDTLPAAAVTHLNFPALIFGIFLIIVVTCGNVLVCISVYLEKALKTTTNYFIVSLAFADLLLAVLVLPLFVYAEVRAVLPNRLIRSAFSTACVQMSLTVTRRKRQTEDKQVSLHLRQFRCNINQEEMKNI